MRRSRAITALCASVAIVGACTNGEGMAGTCLAFSDEQVAVIEDYVDAWNAQDVDAVMAMFSDTAFEDPEGENPAENEAASWRCIHEAAFDTGLFIRIDFDNCVGRYVDASGEEVPESEEAQHLLPAGPVSKKVREGRFDVCRSLCDWSFAFTDDLHFEFVSIPRMLDADFLAPDTYRTCMAEATQ